MNKEVRTVAYDEELRIEAYRFEGIVQPFPNHFHAYYVIGYMESRRRTPSCRRQKYTLQPGFSDQSHFTNYFSCFIGLTPGAYCEIFLRRAD